MNEQITTSQARQRISQPGFFFVCHCFKQWFLEMARRIRLKDMLIALFSATMFPMFGCNNVFYYPDAEIRGTPRDQNLAYEDVNFTAADGTKLHGWFLPAKQKPPIGTVLHLHGNAGNITGHYRFIDWMPARGLNVLTFDYRGYGRSEGMVTREGTLSDGLAALDYLRSRKDVDPNRIVLFGQSLGGALAAEVAAQRRTQVRAVVIDSAFSSYREIVRHHVNSKPLLAVAAWWYPFMVPPGLDPIDAVAKISPTPLLFMHGKNDAIVPWTMSNDLYRAAREPKQIWIAEGMDHTQVWADQKDEARRRFMEICDSALSPANRSTAPSGPRPPTRPATR